MGKGVNVHSFFPCDQIEIANFSSIFSFIVVTEFFFIELATLILFYPIYFFHLRTNVIRKMRVKPSKLKNKLRQTETKKLKIHSTLVVVSKKRRIRTSPKSLFPKNLHMPSRCKVKNLQQSLTHFSPMFHF